VSCFLLGHGVDNSCIYLYVATVVATAATTIAANKVFLLHSVVYRRVEKA